VEDAEPVAGEGHRLAVPLEVALRGSEVVERGLDLGEAQLHQPTGGIVDVHQERADGPAVFEPGVLGAVDLDELAETRAARPRRVAPAGALQPRQPEPRGDQPAAQRLDGHDEAMVLGELLVREGRPEVGVALAHEDQRLLADGRGQPAIARATTPAGAQGRRALAPERAVEPPDLALAQPEQRGRPASGEPPFGQPGHDLQSVQFPHRQPHRRRHGATVGPRRTSLLWGNRTFAFGAYSPG
jgi:hypothetical protein